MATAEKILEIARSQIGARESPANSDNVKYNTAYYGREVSGKYPWCAVFVWWVFREAGAPELYYGGGETAYCPTLMSFHKKQAVTDYRPGDIVFFDGTMGEDVAGITHCGIYVGNHKMLHCGSPIGYADLTDSYWQTHFHSFGRVPN